MKKDQILLWLSLITFIIAVALFALGAMEGKISIGGILLFSITMGIAFYRLALEFRQDK